MASNFAIATHTVATPAVDRVVADGDGRGPRLALPKPTQSTADSVGHVPRRGNDPRVVGRRRIRVSPAARGGRPRDTGKRVEVREITVGVDGERRAVDGAGQPERRRRLAAASLAAGDREHTARGPGLVFEGSERSRQSRAQDVRNQCRP